MKQVECTQDFLVELLVVRILITQWLLLVQVLFAGDIHFVDQNHVL